MLDVGCGNGYYGWRMCAAGAQCVIGIDPTIVYLMQYLAVAKYLIAAKPHFVHAVLPARLEDIPAGSATFDTVFSMGVLYHRRIRSNTCVRCAICCVRAANWCWKR